MLFVIAAAGTRNKNVNGCLQHIKISQKLWLQIEMFIGVTTYPFPHTNTKWEKWSGHKIVCVCDRDAPILPAKCLE